MQPPQSSSLVPLLQRFSAMKAAFVVTTLVADFVMIRLAFVLAYRLRLLGDVRATEPLNPLNAYEETAWILTAVMMATFVARRMYIPGRGVSRVDLLYKVAGATAIGWVFSLAAALLAVRSFDPPRLMLIYWGVLVVLLVWIARVVIDAFLRDARRRGWDLERVLVVGDGEQAEVVHAKIREAPSLGYQVVGFIGAGDASIARVGPILGGLGDVVDVVRRYGVTEVFVAWPGLTHEQLVDIVAGITQEHVNVKIFPDFFDLMARQVETSELTGLPLMRVRDVALRGWGRVVKRGIDLTVGWVLLVLLSPVLLFTALLVKLTSPEGPVLFVQERVGLDGRPFQMIKFRSMRPDAEAETGPVWTAPGDSRRTALGAFMRRFSIDETPQLVNVVAGEMSLVGPRPERPEFVAFFERVVPRYQERHREKAGLTGWAQVNGLRGQSSIEERTKYDLFYVENWTLAFDVKVLLKTIGAVFRGPNAY